MEPTEAINALEVAFRDLIRMVWGDQWLEKSKLPRAPLEAKLNEEQAKRRGAKVSTDLLDYTEFTQLGNVLLANWGDFAPALGKKKYAEAYIDRLNGLRNAPMHSRVLLPFERDLLAGLVGEFRNLIAIYRSERGPDMQYYPVIESAVDSFGNSSLGMNETGIRLKIGDVVSFSCSASDPQGRELTWEISSQLTPTVLNKIARQRGNEVALDWIVDEREVGEEVRIVITVTSSGKYHRRSGHDDARFFSYSVDPPLE